MTHKQTDAFHAAGIANGGITCEEPAGFGDGSGGKLYLAYLRDPDDDRLRAELGELNPLLHKTKPRRLTR